MADQDVDSSSYDSYDESVAAAVEWEGVNQAAVCVEMQEVLDRLGLGRYSAELARMGIATLSDVGKRTPDALIQFAGFSPRECQALVMELLTGCGEPVARSRQDGPAWKRTATPMWTTPPRWDEPSESPTKAAKVAASAAFRRDREEWHAERDKLQQEVATLETQLVELQQSLDDQSRLDGKERAKERLRSVR